MKYILTADEHKALPEETQSEYKEQDGAFVLNLEGHDEHLVPKGKRDIEAEHRKAAEAKVKEIEAREEKLLKDLEAAKGNKGELEDIRKQHETEVARLKSEFAEKETAAKQESYKAMVREEAARFAGEKFTVPSAVSRLIQDRLTVEEVDGNPVLRVLEADGKPSIKSVKELQEEFLTNKEFAPIIKGTNGKGGGAVPNSGGGQSGAKTIQKDQFETMSQDERHTFFKDGGRVEE